MVLQPSHFKCLLEGENNWGSGRVLERAYPPQWRLFYPIYVSVTSE